MGQIGLFLRLGSMYILQLFMCLVSVGGIMRVFGKVQILFVGEGVEVGMEEKEYLWLK